MEIIRRDLTNPDCWESDGIFNRYKFNPILEAVKTHYWEAKMTYNAASFRLDETIYIVYRAIGHDHLSRLGIAWTKNGVDIIGRLSFPIMEPIFDFEMPSDENREARPREKGGCEDPRITVIDDKIYMVYTAYSRLCQSSIASISVSDFKNLIHKSAFGEYETEEKIREDWNNAWERHGLIFPENVEKEVFSRNACVFPVEINGKREKYALIYRIQTSHAMIAYSDAPIGPWVDHETLIVPTEEWEGERMGICTPPIQTDAGMFFVYHGVDIMEKKNARRNYRLGGLFLNFSMNNGKIEVKATKIKSPVLSPERGYEDQSDWLESRDVFAVFCCGAVSFKNKEIVEGDDDILVFYGAGDVRMCAARVKNSELQKLAFDD